jgi:flagellar basal-body rod protein FlgB
MEVGNTRTDQLIALALSGLAARQHVIANNVANVDTPGFKASQVDFESTLRSAMGSGEGLKLAKVDRTIGDDDDLTTMLPRVTTDSGQSRRPDGNSVDIDQQMEQLAEANITYNGLAQVMSGRLQLLRSVINDGHR